MADNTKQTESEAAEDDFLASFAPDAEAGADNELDGAIDDLRGVLKNDAEGSLPDIGESSDFDFDASASAPSEEADLSQFGGDFGGDIGGDIGSDFGGGADTSLDMDAFGGADDFGGGMAAEPSQPAGSALQSNMDLIMDIPIDVQIVLGNSHMHVATLMNLTEGATIALDRKIGEPVEIIVNGRLIGRGEITVLEEDNSRFGVRIIEVNAVKNNKTLKAES